MTPDELIEHLTRTTGVSRKYAAQWVQLGEDRGWSLSQTRDIAEDLIAGRVNLGDLRKALVPPSEWQRALDERWRAVEEDVAAATPRPPHAHPVDQWATES